MKYDNKLSLIRQKGESQNGGNKKTKHTKFSEKKKNPEHFLPLDTHTYVFVSGSKKCSFLGKLGVLYFPVTFVFKFAFLPYYRRLNVAYIQMVKMYPN